MNFNQAVLFFLFSSVVVTFFYCKFRLSKKDFPRRAKRILRSGQTSTIYFLLDKSNGNVKFGRAVNFDRRFKTHLTSNRDLVIIRVFPETETFNETLIKKRFGQNEWVPFTNDLKFTIASGQIKWN